jgi:hypothetical protein
MLAIPKREVTGVAGVQELQNERGTEARASGNVSAYRRVGVSAFFHEQSVRLVSEIVELVGARNGETSRRSAETCQLSVLSCQRKKHSQNEKAAGFSIVLLAPDS